MRDQMILACDLSRRYPVLGLGDINGNLICKKEIRISENELAEEIRDRIYQSVLELMGECDIEAGNVKKVVIAFPGIINDDSSHKLLNDQFIKLFDYNLNEMLGEMFNASIIIKNDINLAALGEKFYGVGREYRNLIFLSAGCGIGAGLIINGDLYEGDRRAAGELGFTIPTMISDRDTDYWTLEELISIPALEKRINKELVNNEDSILCTHKRKVYFEDFVEGALLGDPYCCSIAYEIGKYLGMIAGNICTVLDMPLIVIGGEISKLGYRLIKEIENIVNLITPINSRVEISTLENAEILGAIKVGIDELTK